MPYLTSMPTVTTSVILFFQPVRSLFEPLHGRQRLIATSEIVESCLKKAQIKTSKACKSKNSPGVTKITSVPSLVPSPAPGCRANSSG